MLSKIMARIALYGALIAILLVGYQVAKNWLTGPDPSYVTVYRHVPKPRVAKETKDSKKMDSEIRCVVTEVKSPTKEEIDTLAQKYPQQEIKIDWEGLDLLGEYQIPKMPYGGEAVVGVQDSSPVVVMKPFPAPFFQLGGMGEIGVAAGVGTGGIATWRVKFRQDLFRVGPVVGTGEVNVTGRGSMSHFAALLEANVRF